MTLKQKLIAVVLLCLMLAGGTSAFAQDESGLLSPMDLLPAAYNMEGFRYEPQGWNNCGPATLTMGLSFFGYSNDQNTSAAWLKPNGEDKNVSPWQMVEYVNAHTSTGARAMLRYGGTQDQLKALVSANFPVIIEAGYDPPPHDLGWMGHYLLVKGYDDAAQTFSTHDSYDGPNYNYAYAEIADKWKHFNYVYIVLYDVNREAELAAVLGDDFDEKINISNALARAQADAVADGTDPFAWFNVGTNYVLQGEYEFAALAYDEARKWGLPWRMMWYQFGPFEAYNAVGRYDDTITLAQQNLNDGGGQYVEETYYYAGVAREGMGDTQRALTNYNSALQFNPNFTPAREARDRLAG
ncbi:MAG: C39 family peptidase [Chloroflexota bacterium]